MRSRTFASAKFGALLALVDAHDVFLVQESHGTIADCWELRRRLHASHSVWFSLRPRANAGGLLFIVKRRFLSLLINFHFVVLSAGRVAFLSLYFPFGAISFVNVHILPTLPIGARRDLFHRISGALPLPSRHSVFFSRGLDFCWFLVNLTSILSAALKGFVTMAPAPTLPTRSPPLPSYFKIRIRTKMLPPYLG